MSETDWELKDRRIAWQTITKALAEVQAALIQSKMVKFTNLSDAMQDLNMSRDIELASFFVIGTNMKSHPDSGGPTTEDQQEASSPLTSFESPVGVVASPPSPKKKKEVKQEKVEGEWYCSTGGCGARVSTRVWEYSNDKYGRTLCFECQENEKKRIEEARGPKDL